MYLSSRKKDEYKKGDIYYFFRIELSSLFYITLYQIQLLEMVNEHDWKCEIKKQFINNTISKDCELSYHWITRNLNEINDEIEENKLNKHLIIGCIFTKKFL